MLEYWRTSIEYNIRYTYSTLLRHLCRCKPALSIEETEVISCRGTLCVDDTCQSMTPRADAVTMSADQA